MKGEYRLKAFIGKPFYGHVILEYTYSNIGNSIVIEYEIGEVPLLYQKGIEAGVSFFYFYSLNSIGSLNVRITKIHGIPIDTTFPVLMYVTAMALCDAKGEVINGLEINKKGAIEFPKGI